MSLPDSSVSAMRLSETVTMPHLTDAGACSLCFAGIDMDVMRREDRRRSKGWLSELTLNKVSFSAPTIWRRGGERGRVRVPGSAPFCGHARLIREFRKPLGLPDSAANAGCTHPPNPVSP